jgi:hypothetical protein
MGLEQKHALGRNRRLYVTREVTPGTFVPPSGADAIKVTKSQMDITVERINRRDASQTASTVERITGRRTVSWSVECYASGSGSAGTPPDYHDLLLAWFGGYANTPGTSDEYSLSDSQSARGTCSVTQEFNSVAMQSLRGSWVEQLKFSYTGTSLPVFAFEGGAMDLQHTGASTLDGSASDGATTISVDDIHNFSVGSVIKIGSSDNSAGDPPGHLVTGKGNTSLTVSPAVDGLQADESVVAPFVPTEETSGSPISHVLCTATIDSIELPVVSFELVGKNNFKAHDDEAGTATVSDVTPGWRDITGTITVRARQDQALHFGKFLGATATTRSLEIVAGNSDGNTITFTLGQVEIENAKFEAPEADECMITLPFFARGSSGADELSVTFT